MTIAAFICFAIFYGRPAYQRHIAVGDLQVAIAAADTTQITTALDRIDELHARAEAASALAAWQTGLCTQGESLLMLTLGALATEPDASVARLRSTRADQPLEIRCAAYRSLFHFVADSPAARVALRDSSRDPDVRRVFDIMIEILGIDALEINDPHWRDLDQSYYTYLAVDLREQVPITSAETLAKDAQHVQFFREHPAEPVDFLSIIRFLFGTAGRQ